MRKLALLLAAAVLAAPVAFGQKTQLQHLLQNPLSTLHRNLQSLNGVAASAAKTTAQQQRIIGYSALSVSSGNSLTDSARIRYNSAARGSQHDPNDLSSYFFSFSPEGVYYPKVEMFFDQGPLRIKADTVTQYDVDGIYRATGFSYNGANQPTQMRSSYYNFGAYGGRDRYTMTYDANGQRTKIQYDVDTATTAPGSFIADYTVNSRFGSAPGRILSDSLVPSATAISYTDPIRYVYSYTGNNISAIDFFVMNSGIYELLQKVTFSYDASNRVRITEVFADQGNGLDPFIKDSLTYTGSNLFASGNYILINNGSSYNIVQAVRYTTNAQNLRDTARYFNDAGNLIQYVAYSYNSYGNPASYRLYIPQNSTTTPEETGRFHYELYDPAAVNTVAATMQNLNAVVRPNPVYNAATLSWNAFAGTVTVHLTDAAGRLLEMVQVPATAGIYQLNMDRYATGLYMATFQTAEGQKQTLQIVKQ